jgi:hypothetical protein
MAERRKAADLVVKARDGTEWVFEIKCMPGTGVNEAQFAEMLRLAIGESGISQYRLAKIAEVPQGAISVFLAGGDLRLSTFTKIAHIMGFELRQNSAKAPKQIKPTMTEPKATKPKTIRAKGKK